MNATWTKDIDAIVTGHAGDFGFDHVIHAASVRHGVTSWLLAGRGSDQYGGWAPVLSIEASENETMIWIDVSGGITEALGYSKTKVYRIKAPSHLPISDQTRSKILTIIKGVSYELGDLRSKVGSPMHLSPTLRPNPNPFQEGPGGSGIRRRPPSGPAGPGPNRSADAEEHRQVAVEEDALVEIDLA